MYSSGVDDSKMGETTVKGFGLGGDDTGRLKNPLAPFVA
jgi:hypothetical protein